SRCPACSICPKGPCSLDVRLGDNVAFFPKLIEPNICRGELSVVSDLEIGFTPAARLACLPPQSIRRGVRRPENHSLWRPIDLCVELGMALNFSYREKPLNLVWVTGTGVEVA